MKKRIYAMISAVAFATVGTAFLYGCTNPALKDSSIPAANFEYDKVEIEKNPIDLEPSIVETKPVQLPEKEAKPIIVVEESKEQISNLADLNKEKKGWGQGKQVDEKNRPTACLTAQEKYGKYAGNFIGEDSNEIYLTFDQGYENGYTASILDVLKEKNVPVVFFLTYDYAKKNKELVQRMIDEGHLLGNHSVKHLSMPLLSEEEMKLEISKLHDYIKEEFNYEMYLFRPPMGEYSEQSLAVTQSLGYESVLWSFAYRDWEVDNQMEETKALNILLNSAHNGEILLLHSVSKTNTAILSQLIDELRAKDFLLTSLEL